MNEPASQHESRIHWTAVSIWLFAIGLCLACALPQSFSSMAIYDDESYVMMTIKTFLEGDRLYAETYTQYGPAYYMLQQPIHGWLNMPLTHDWVRLKTVFAWVLSGLLCGLTVFKVTGHRLAGIGAMLLSVLHLQKLGLEPAHPQEVVTVLSAFCILLMSKKNRWFLFFAGACAALAGLTKLNAGSVLAAGLLFAAGMANPGKRRFDWIYPAFGAFIALGISAGVFVSIAQHSVANGRWNSLFWPAIILASALAVCFVAWRRDSEKFNADSFASAAKRRWLQPFAVVAAGGIIGSIFVVAWSMFQGNSIDEIVHGVLTQHRFMGDAFYHPIVANQLGVVFVVASLAILLVKFFGNRSDEASHFIDSTLLALPVAVLGIAVLQIIVDSMNPLLHGLNPRGAALFLATAGPAMMPILIMCKRSQLRLALAMTGCLSPLVAFPVPGTQVSLGTLPILIALIVSAVDACEHFAKEASVETILRRSVLGLTVVLLGVSIVFSNRWLNNTALDQPGCRWVMLESERAEKERVVAERIRSVDSPWLAFDTHNHNRFFFWTGKKPLTSTSPTFWPAMLNENQKEQIEDAAASVN